MRITYLKGRTRQRGFTLIEMMVVIFIMLVLATMLVAVLASPIMVQDKARRGGDMMQGFLRGAKSLAVANRNPCGVRSIVDADGYVRQLQYIEQPSDFVALMPPDPSTPPGTPWQPNPLTIKIVNGQVIAQLFTPPGAGVEDFTGGLSSGAGYGHDDPSWPVQGDKLKTLNNGQTVILPGDYLEVQGGGLLHRIGNVFPHSPDNSVFTSYLVLDIDPATLAAQGGQIGPTAQWRVIRQPRVLKGETPLLLPQDVAIDFNNYKNLYNAPNDLYLGYPPNSPAGTTDILFAPSGRVLGALGAQDRIVLWVRDITQDLPYQNNPVLVSIHTRTGFIAVQPVNLNDPTNVNKFDPTYSDNWWLFTQDGRLSGL
jgi:prepilin-type N-terminal cleavage/methylation domain-containing protein